MSFSITYDPKEKCLRGKFTGDLNTKTVKAYIEEISKAAKEHNCQRFLNDLRDANVLFSIADFYNATAKVSVGPFDRFWKRAIVVNKISDKLLFFETASTNRGYRVKIFENMEDALEWLRQ